MSTEGHRDGRSRGALPLIVSLLIHGGLAALLFVLPERPEASKRLPIELTSRKLRPRKPQPPPPEKRTPPKPKPKAPPPDPTPRKVAMRTRPRRPPPPKPEQPQGRPDSKTPPAPDTGAKTFGIKMKGTTTAAPGTGVQVPQGQTLRTDPRVRKIGKGKPKAKPGFKKRYAKNERAPVAVVTSMPRVLKRVQAVYPARMRELGIEGRVVLELTVDASGKVVAVRVVRGLRKELDRAAMAAARKMRFSPAKVKGTAVKIKIPYTFTFVLD